MLVFSSALNIRWLNLKGEVLSARPLWIRRENLVGAKRIKKKLPNTLVDLGVMLKVVR